MFSDFYQNFREHSMFSQSADSIFLHFRKILFDYISGIPLNEFFFWG